MNSATIQAAFRQIFTSSREFGRNTFIIGKDAINRTIKRNIIEHYLVGFAKEIPLLVFAYTDELNRGFVLTNFRLIWRYSDGDEEYDIYLEDIQRAEAGRLLLARTMTIIDVTGKEYPRMYMTGMDNVDTFVAQFNEFIALIHGVDDEDTSAWPSYDDELEKASCEKIRTCGWQYSQSGRISSATRELSRKNFCQSRVHVRQIHLSRRARRKKYRESKKSHRCLCKSEKRRIWDGLLRHYGFRRRRGRNSFDEQRNLRSQSV